MFRLRSMLADSMGEPGKRPHEREPLGARLEDWSAAAVGQFLEDIGLAPYKPLFDAVDGATFCQFNEKDLEDFGVNKLIDRKKLLGKRAAKLANESIGAALLDGTASKDFALKTPPPHLFIKKILDNYPEGAQVLREALQNAEDAKASTMRVVLDLQHYPSSSLIAPGYQGPALVICNDSHFTDEDFESLQEMYQSRKAAKPDKIGRFGIGSRSFFHIADVIFLASETKFAILDPNCHTFKSGGKIFDIRCLAAECPDQVAPFEPYGGPAAKFRGTTFRLPLRTEAMASKSLICNVPYTQQKAEAMLAQFCDESRYGLLFLNSVRVVEVARRSASGKEEAILSARAETPPSATSTAEYLRQFDNCEDLATDLRRKPQTHSNYELTLSLTHTQASQVEDRVQRSKWHMFQTLVSDEQLLSLACKLHGSPHIGIAMPSAAWSGTQPSSIIGGTAFCYLPLPLSTGLPVHVHAAFALADNRRDLWLGEDLAGEALDKSYWNKALIRNLAKLYADALLTSSASPAPYLAWPREADVAETWRPLVAQLRTSLQSRPCLWSPSLDDRGRLVSPSEAAVLSSELGALGALAGRIAVAGGEAAVMLPEHVLNFLAPVLRVIQLSDFYHRLALPTLSRLVPAEVDALMVHLMGVMAAAPAQRKDELISAAKQWKLGHVEQGFPSQGGPRTCLAELFDPAQEQFRKLLPDGKRLLSAPFDKSDFLEILRRLGLRTALTWDDVVAVAKDIERTGVDDGRPQLLASYITRLNAGALSATAKQELIETIEWVPQLEQQSGFPAWAEVRPLRTLQALSRHSWLESCFAAAPISALKDDVGVASLAGWNQDPPPSLLHEQLVSLAKCGGDSKQLLPCVCAVFERLKACTIAESPALDRLRHTAWVPCSEGLFQPSRVCLRLGRELEPYINSAPPELLRYNNKLLLHLGLQAELSEALLQGVLKEIQDIQNKTGTKQPLRDLLLLETALAIPRRPVEKTLRDEDVAVWAMQHLVPMLRKKGTSPGIDQLVLCTDGQLRQSQSGRVMYNDANWCNLPPDWFEVHQRVSHFDAQVLGCASHRALLGQQLDKPWEPIGESFGQQEDLASRIAGLLRDYSDAGCGIESCMREFFQNADDAGSRRFHVVLDERVHSSERVLNDETRKVHGPAVIITMDSVLDEVSLSGLQRLGASAKRTDACTTGRFGIGMNAMYHLTDAPQLLCVGVDALCFFDPLFKYVAKGLQEGARPGRRFSASKMGSTFPDHIAAFTLPCDTELPNGTRFRLPLRQEFSKLKQRIPAPAKIRDELCELAAQVDKWLLFSRNVRSIGIWHVKADGSVQDLVNITAESSPEDVSKLERFHAMAAQLSAQHPPTVAAQELESLTQARAVIHVKCTGKQAATKWVCCFRFMPGLLKDAAESSATVEAAVLPLAGVAAPLTTTNGAAGQMFATLPLPILTGLPVHVHGSMYVDSSRRSLPTDAARMGAAAAWNRKLLLQAATAAYGDLLDYCRLEMETGDGVRQFEMWLPTRALSTEWHDLIVAPVLQAVGSEGHLPAAGGWRSAAEVLCDATARACMHSDAYLRDVRPLLGQLSSLCDLSASAQSALIKEQPTLIQLDRACVCGMLRGNSADDAGAVPLDKALPAILKCRPSVVLLLDFIISALPGPSADLEGVPLLLLHSGRLDRFGLNRKFYASRFAPLLPLAPDMFLAADVEALMPGVTRGVSPLPGWSAATPAMVASNLDCILDSAQMLAFTETGAVDSTPELVSWLRAFFKFVEDEGSVTELGSVLLHSLPLIPTRTQLVKTSDAKSVVDLGRWPRDWHQRLQAVLSKMGCHIANEDVQLPPQLQESLCGDGRGLSAALMKASDKIRNLCPEEIDTIVELFLGMPAFEASVLELPLFQNIAGQRSAITEVKQWCQLIDELPEGLNFELLHHAPVLARTKSMRAFGMKLDIPSIGLAVFLERYVVSVLMTMEASSRLRWLDVARGASGSHPQCTLVAKLVPVPFVETVSGECRTASCVIDPARSILRKCFGTDNSVMPAAPFNPNLWLHFLRILGCRTELSADEWLTQAHIAEAGTDKDLGVALTGYLLKACGGMVAGEKGASYQQQDFIQQARLLRIVPAKGEQDGARARAAHVTSTVAECCLPSDWPLLFMKAAMLDKDLIAKAGYALREDTLMSAARTLGIVAPTIELVCNNLTDMAAAWKDTRGEQVLAGWSKLDVLGMYRWLSVSLENSSEESRDHIVRCMQAGDVWLATDDKLYAQPCICTGDVRKAFRKHFVQLEQTVLDRCLHLTIACGLRGQPDIDQLRTVLCRIHQEVQGRSISGTSVESTVLEYIEQLVTLWKIVKAEPRRDGDLIVALQSWHGNVFLLSDKGELRLSTELTRKQESRIMSRCLDAKNVHFLHESVDKMLGDCVELRQKLGILRLSFDFCEEVVGDVQDVDAGITVQRMAFFQTHEFAHAVGAFQCATTGTRSYRELTWRVVGAFNTMIRPKHAEATLDQSQYAPRCHYRRDGHEILVRSMSAESDADDFTDDLCAAICCAIGLDESLPITVNAVRGLIRCTSVLGMVAVLRHVGTHRAEQAALVLMSSDLRPWCQAAGQHEKLTSRLKHVLESYTFGMPLFKELAQNASDARASRISFIWDWRQHPKNRLLTKEMASWQGPCLWIYSDSIFTDQDWCNLCKLGVGGKQQDGATIGHNGLGFNIVYHLTDLPSIVSGETILFLDPHVRHLHSLGADQGRPGVTLKYREIPDISRYADQFAPYKDMFGFAVDAAFQGTLIRLPLRQAYHHPQSEISDFICKSEDADNLLAEFRREAPAWLLFLPGVANIEVCEVGLGASFLELKTKFRCRRTSTRDGDDRMDGTGADEVRLEHLDLHVECLYADTDRVDMHTEAWYLISREIQPHDGARNRPHGARIGHPSTALAFPKHRHLKSEEPRLCCYFPVWHTSSGQVRCDLPVAVHGRFALTSDRTTLVTKLNSIDPQTASSAKANQELARSSVLTLYAELFRALIASGEDADIKHLLPVASQLSEELRELFDFNQLYTSIRGARLFCDYSATFEETLHPCEADAVNAFLQERAGLKLSALRSDVCEHFQSIGAVRKRIDPSLLLRSVQGLCDPLSSEVCVELLTFLGSLNSADMTDLYGHHSNTLIVPMHDGSIKPLCQCFVVPQEKKLIDVSALVCPGAILSDLVPEPAIKWLQHMGSTVRRIGNCEDVASLMREFPSAMETNLAELSRMLLDFVISQDAPDLTPFAGLPIIPTMTKGQFAKLDRSRPLVLWKNADDRGLLQDVLQRVGVAFVSIKDLPTGIAELLLAFAYAVDFNVAGALRALATCAAWEQLATGREGGDSHVDFQLLQEFFFAPDAVRTDDERQQLCKLPLFFVDGNHCGATAFMFVDEAELAELLGQFGVRHVGDTVFAQIRTLLTVSSPLAALTALAGRVAATLSVLLIKGLLRFMSERLSPEELTTLAGLRLLPGGACLKDIFHPEDSLVGEVRSLLPAALQLPDGIEVNSLPVCIRGLLRVPTTASELLDLVRRLEGNLHDLPQHDHFMQHLISKLGRMSDVDIAALSQNGFRGLRIFPLGGSWCSSRDVYVGQARRLVNLTSCPFLDQCPENATSLFAGMPTFDLVKEQLSLLCQIHEGHREDRTLDFLAVYGFLEAQLRTQANATSATERLTELRRTRCLLLDSGQLEYPHMASFKLIVDWPPLFKVPQRLLAFETLLTALGVSERVRDEPLPERLKPQSVCSSLFGDCDFCDLRFTTSDGDVGAHRCVVFRLAPNASALASAAAQIAFPQATRRDVIFVKRYLYTGHIDTQALRDLDAAPGYRAIAEALGVQFLKEYLDLIIYGAPPASIAAPLDDLEVPLTWASGGTRFRLVDCESEGFVAQFQNLLRQTGVHCGTSANARVQSVRRIENIPLWREYASKKRSLVERHRAHAIQVKPLSPPVMFGGRDLVGALGHLDSLSNEKYLFHGTSSHIAELISEHGFDERVASLGGLYGGGIYFAEASCKSLQYAPAEDGLHRMLYCRVLLGDPHYTQQQMTQVRRPPDRRGSSGLLYDAVVANSGAMAGARSGRQEHREFIVYDRTQVYPEFLVTFAA